MKKAGRIAALLTAALFLLAAAPPARIISTATVELTSLENGKLGILIETLAEEECEEIVNIAVLECRQKDGSWKEVARYEYRAEKEDFPTEDLSGMTNTAVSERQKIGRYYRIRGIHCAWAGGQSQIVSSRTEPLQANRCSG